MTMVPPTSGHRWSRLLTGLCLPVLGAAAVSCSSPAGPDKIVNPQPSVSIVSAQWSLSRTRVAANFYRVTGTINVQLNRAISPAPSRVRAEFATSMVGGSTTSVSGLTNLRFDINQDTVACPQFPASGDTLRLIDVDRQVVVASTGASHTGAITSPC